MNQGSVSPQAERAEGSKVAGGHNRPILGVGHVEPQPWSYQAELWATGMNQAALDFVAERLGRAIEYRATTQAALADGLVRRDYDVAMGGLLNPGQPALVAVRVPQKRFLSGDDRLRPDYRRAFFPEIWWIRKSDSMLRWRIKIALFWWQVKAPRLESSDTEALLNAKTSGFAPKK